MEAPVGRRLGSDVCSLRSAHVSGCARSAQVERCHPGHRRRRSAAFQTNGDRSLAKCMRSRSMPGCWIRPMPPRDPLPANLIPIRADARALDFPSDITAGVLMMRHCTCFGLYARKTAKGRSDPPDHQCTLAHGCGSSRFIRRTSIICRDRYGLVCLPVRRDRFQGRTCGALVD